MKKFLLSVFCLGLGVFTYAQGDFTTSLEGFEWDEHKNTNRAEAFRILDTFGGEFVHVHPVKEGQYLACSQLNSGEYTSIEVNQNMPFRKHYTIYKSSRQQHNEHSFLNSQEQNTSYQIDKQTNPDYESSFFGVTAKNFKEKKYSFISNTFKSDYLIRMIRNPMDFSSIEFRTIMLNDWLFNPRTISADFAPIILSKSFTNQFDSYHKGDLILGIWKKDKVDKIDTYNHKRKLTKGKKPYEVVVFRRGRFLLKEWDPKDRTYEFYTIPDFEEIYKDIVYYILNSGEIYWGYLKHHGVYKYPLKYAVTRGFNKTVFNWLIGYGGDIFQKSPHGETLLHFAAGSENHHQCTYYEHNDLYSKEIQDEAYFYLMQLGLRDDDKADFKHPKLGYNTPKQFYLLSKDPNHQVPVKEKSKVDWGAVANAVVAGVGAAVEEKQRQIDESNQINQINQEYQAQVDKRIEAQKRQVEQSNAEYAARVASIRQASKEQTTTPKVKQTVQSTTIEASSSSSNPKTNSESQNTAQQNITTKREPKNSIAISWKVENDRWFAAGPGQALQSDMRSEEGALALVTKGLSAKLDDAFNAQITFKWYDKDHSGSYLIKVYTLSGNLTEDNLDIFEHAKSIGINLDHYKD